LFASFIIRAYRHFSDYKLEPLSKVIKRIKNMNIEEIFDINTRSNYGKIVYTVQVSFCPKCCVCRQNGSFHFIPHYLTRQFFPQAVLI